MRFLKEEKWTDKKKYGLIYKAPFGYVDFKYMDSAIPMKEWVVGW